jgi:hypothetical protein
MLRDRLCERARSFHCWPWISGTLPFTTSSVGLQMVATGSGSAAPKKAAKEQLLQLCGYSADAASVKQTAADGTAVTVCIRNIEQTDEVKKVVQSLHNAAVISVSAVIKSPSTAFMHPNFDQCGAWTLQDVLGMKNLHSRIVEHLITLKRIDTRNMLKVVEMCKAQSAYSSSAGLTHAWYDVVTLKMQLVSTLAHAGSLYVPPTDLTWPDKALRRQLKLYRESLKQWCVFIPGPPSAPPSELLEPLKFANCFAKAVLHMRYVLSMMLEQQLIQLDTSQLMPASCAGLCISDAVVLPFVQFCCLGLAVH